MEYKLDTTDTEKKQNEQTPIQPQVYNDSYNHASAAPQMVISQGIPQIPGPYEGYNAS